MKKAIVIGAGPAGLTAANELLKNKDYEVISEDEYREKKNNPFKDFHLE